MGSILKKVFVSFLLALSLTTASVFPLLAQSTYIQTGESGSLTSTYLWARNFLAIGDHQNQPRASWVPLQIMYDKTHTADDTGTHWANIAVYPNIAGPCPGCGFYDYNDFGRYTNPDGNNWLEWVGYEMAPTINNGTGTIGSIIGVRANANVNTNTGTITNFYGVRVSSAIPPGTVTNLWGYNMEAGNTSGGKTWQNNFAGRTTFGAQTEVDAGDPVPSVRLQAVTFANLGTPAAGVMVYCSDCNPANCTAGASTGSFCKRQNGAWLPM